MRDARSEIKDTNSILTPLIRDHSLFSRAPGLCAFMIANRDGADGH